MQDQSDPQEVARALVVSIDLFVKWARLLPSPEGLTMPEISALRRLERTGPTTPGAMAKAAQISPQGMGATLAVLEARGYVGRRDDPTDGRRALMSVTDAGRLTLENDTTARAEKFGKALSEGFSRGDLKALMTAARLIERLGEAL